MVCLGSAMILQWWGMPLFFSIGFDGGDGLPSICFHFSVGHGLPLSSMAGEPLAISMEVHWNLS